jgi:hypothetical protein
LRRESEGFRERKQGDPFIPTAQSQKIKPKPQITYIGTPTHHQQPKTGTPTSNPSPDLVKKKKKTETQICSCFNGFFVREILGGLFAMRDQLWADCCSRSAPEGLLCEIGWGGGWSCARKRERARRGGGGRGERLRYFGKWFTENFSVNRFPNFAQRFFGQQQIFSVDFGFTAKQTSENDENILRKTFYVETNGALTATVGSSWMLKKNFC